MCKCVYLSRPVPRAARHDARAAADERRARDTGFLNNLLLRVYFLHVRCVMTSTLARGLPTQSCIV